MAKSNLKLKSATPQEKVRKIRVEKARSRCSWPKGEPVPISMGEALALGWRVDDDDVTGSEDEKTADGVYTLEKRVGSLLLSIRIRYHAEFTFRKPYAAQAHSIQMETVILPKAVAA
jgi:hypothetical protein